MPTLVSDLRNKLEKAVIEARDVAEAGARAALEVLAVHEPKYYPHMFTEQQDLRNHLRARARQLGDRQDASGRLAIDHLVSECAYDYWHRMIFARFLAENGLLIEPQEKMAISLAEAEELAKEDSVDVWVFASRCAQEMLPQIFRPEDPLLQVSFAMEHRIKLEGLLNSLLPAVFTASDALGWVYQFWQSKKKDEVNRSEVKIGADEIAAVTQLFTEPYMVEFLLHNTLGAWWAGKRFTSENAANATTEDELRRKLALPGVTWWYLRFVRGADGKAGPWRPAAGMFDGWPKTAAELKVLDPCCGSGHFLVAALYHLVPIRMAEEGLSAREAVDAVLRDNLHGLEIDERCCQIAAFALAFAAWTYPDASGYRPLPDLHIACTGIGPQSTAEEWVRLAEQSGLPIPALERQAIRNGLLNLHRLFSQAPTLGSLINPAQVPADMFVAGYETIQPYLAAILKAETSDDELRERAIAAAGMVKAADLLADKYTLVMTNVPYLGRGDHDPILASFADDFFAEAKADLATVFAARSFDWLARDGSLAIVTPQNWLFLPRFENFRKLLLTKRTWHIVVRMGEHAFESTAAAGAFAAMEVFGQVPPEDVHSICGIDVSAPRGRPPIYATQKAAMLCGQEPVEIGFIRQQSLLSGACVIRLSPTENEGRLGDYLRAWQGLVTGDDNRFLVSFWEVSGNATVWSHLQRPPGITGPYTGRSELIRWEQGNGSLHHDSKAHNFPPPVTIGRSGVAAQRMGTISVTLYEGDIFNDAVAPLIPHDEKHLPPIWAFAESPEFREAVRAVNQKVNVTPGSFHEVEFDLDYWQKVASEKYPDGLPQPESDDPTQWLFHGRPEESTATLQVAVARLLGYRWPAELDEKMRLSKRARALVKQCDELAKFADDDGIVCIPSVRGEEPAADRLLALLAAAGVKPAKVRELAGGTDLDEWLRNSFFEEHCKLFQDRPCVWHIWDGRKRDGFHALVYYQKLCEDGGKGRKLLESLTYSYLGEWITRQKDGVKRGEGGAEDRLAAALELQNRLVAILAGEPPFDLFIRWKPLAEQPIGWEPDINDGVRMNIRPFLALDLTGGRSGAGVLRYKPNIKWTKDRGKEPQRPKAEYSWFWGWDEKTVDFLGGKEFDSNRWNGCHYTNKAKQAAREAAKEAKRG